MMRIINILLILIFTILLLISCCIIACPAWCQQAMGDLGLDPNKHAQAHHQIAIIITSAPSYQF